VSTWLGEDCPSFDYGGYVVGEEIFEAKLLGKSSVRVPHLAAPHGEHVANAHKLKTLHITFPSNILSIRASWQVFRSSTKFFGNWIARMLKSLLST
jgi:hypothetical protein